MLSYNSTYNFVNYLVYNAIFDRFFGIHPVVAVKIFHDLLHCLATIFSQYSCAHLFYTLGLFGLDFQVGTYSLIYPPNDGWWIITSPCG